MSDLKELHGEQDKTKLVLKEYKDKGKTKALTTDERLERIERLLDLDKVAFESP